MSKNHKVSIARSQHDWRQVAARLGEKIPLARGNSGVWAWLEKENRESKLWVVAVSGGADSVALVLLLWAHFPKMRRRLVVLHFDHGTREESAADATFVKELAKGLGVDFETERRAAGGAMSEAALREARWTFFRKRLKARKARVIFLGQQRDDIAETMLMGLARGSGAGGLSAPRPVRVWQDGVVALRPLLEISGKELRATLRVAGGGWREDKSNDSAAYLRNRLRREVIPAWRAAAGARDVEAGAARSRALLEEDDEALEGMAEILLQKVKAGEVWNFTPMVGQSKAVWRRALRRWLGLAGVGDSVSAQAFETVLDAATTGRPGRWSAGVGRWIELEGGELELIEASSPTKDDGEPLLFTPGDTLKLPTGGWLETRLVKVDQSLRERLNRGELNPEREALLGITEKSAREYWCVRPWKPGDRYQALGSPGRRKLQDMFTDKKIPAKERRRLPVVCIELDKPVWAPGLPPENALRVTVRTRLALRLTYHRNSERILR